MFHHIEFNSNKFPLRYFSQGEDCIFMHVRSAFNAHR